MPSSSMRKTAYSSTYGSNSRIILIKSYTRSISYLIYMTAPLCLVIIFSSLSALQNADMTRSVVID